MLGSVDLPDDDVARLRLARILARAHPRPTIEDAESAAGMAVGVVVVASIATIPYLVDLSTVAANRVASVLLFTVIGSTGFASVRRAGGSVGRAALFALIVVAVAVVVVSIKFALTH